MKYFIPYILFITFFLTSSINTLFAQEITSKTKKVVKVDQFKATSEKSSKKTASPKKVLAKPIESEPTKKVARPSSTQKKIKVLSTRKESELKKVATKSNDRSIGKDKKGRTIYLESKGDKYYKNADGYKTYLKKTTSNKK